MNQTMINQWLQPLASVVGQPLALDGRGLLGLELDGGLQCTIEHDADSDTVVFHSELYEIPPGETAPLCIAAMEKNLYGVGSFGITLGLDQRRSMIVGSMTLPVSTLSEESFVIQLERFVSGIDELHRAFLRQTPNGESFGVQS